MFLWTCQDEFPTTVLIFSLYSFCNFPKFLFLYGVAMVGDMGIFSVISNSWGIWPTFKLNLMLCLFLIHQIPSTCSDSEVRLQIHNHFLYPSYNFLFLWTWIVGCRCEGWWVVIILQCRFHGATYLLWAIYNFQEDHRFLSWLLVMLDGHVEFALIFRCYFSSFVFFLIIHSICICSINSAIVHVSFATYRISLRLLADTVHKQYLINIFVWLCRCLLLHQFWIHLADSNLFGIEA